MCSRFAASSGVKGDVRPVCKISQRQLRSGTTRGMKLEMRRGLGLCRGAGSRDRSCSLAAADVKFGRWQRSHNSVFFCCGFIFIFFAIVTTVSYFFEPSILKGGETQPLSKWYPDGLSSIVDREVSATQNSRRILAGGAHLTEVLELRQDVVDHRRRGLEAKDVYRKEQWKPPADGLDHHENLIPSGLETGLRIFVYELPPAYNVDWLNNSRCSNHLFAAEVALHRVLLESPMRTMDPEKAAFFFVPVYVACNFSPKNGFPTLNKAAEILRSAVDLISRQMVYWDRNRGRDHVFVATHDYGACFNAMEDRAIAVGIPQFMRNSIILQTFGEQGGNHPCQTAGSILIPPYVSPKSVQEHWKPVETQVRDIWAHFRGKLELHPKSVKGQFYSKGVRTRLWQKFKKNRKFFLQRKRLDGYQSEMLRSKFCLAPLGWAPWSPRIVESVLYGCVPVIIADNIALPYSHAIDWASISLTVSEKDVSKLDKILSDVAVTNLTTIQKNLWQEKNRRALLYTQPSLQGDASWQIFDLLARKKLLREFPSLSEPHRSIFGNGKGVQLPGQSVEFSSI